MAKIPALSIIHMSANTPRVLCNALRFKLANRSPTVRYVPVVDAGGGLRKYTKFACECFYKLGDAFFSLFRFLRTVLENRGLDISWQIEHTSAITFWFFSSFFIFSSWLRILFCPVELCPVELVASPPSSSCKAVFISRASERWPIMGKNFSPPNIAARMSSKRGPRMDTVSDTSKDFLWVDLRFILSIHSEGKGFHYLVYVHNHPLVHSPLDQTRCTSFYEKRRLSGCGSRLLGMPPTSERHH
jgi:hypothetical protein